MSEKEFDTYEPHFDRMERERQAQEADHRKTLAVQEHETKRAKLAARESTKEMLIYIGGFLAAAAVLVTLGLVWWTDLGENPTQEPKVSDAQVEQQREERCIDTGGGWLPKNTFSGSYPDSGMCIYPGQTATDTEK